MAISYRGEGGVGGRGGSSMGSSIGKAVKKVAEKAAEKESIVKIANTKPVRAATKVAVKAVNKATKKSADAARQKNIDKFSTNYVAKGSVKKTFSTNPSEAKRRNELSNARTQDIATGARAKRESDAVKQSKPAKVVKINSAPAKSPDAAKAANEKALKAANKGKKK